jgi:hypothetical protein
VSQALSALVDAVALSSAAADEGSEMETEVGGGGTLPRHGPEPSVAGLNTSVKSIFSLTFDAAPATAAEAVKPPLTAARPPAADATADPADATGIEGGIATRRLSVRPTLPPLVVDFSPAPSEQGSDDGLDTSVGVGTPRGPPPPARALEKPSPALVAARSTRHRNALRRIELTRQMEREYEQRKRALLGR